MIANVGGPINPNDVANKKYVDSKTSDPIFIGAKEYTKAELNALFQRNADAVHHADSEPYEYVFKLDAHPGNTLKLVVISIIKTTPHDPEHPIIADLYTVHKITSTHIISLTHNIPRNTYLGNPDIIVLAIPYYKKWN